MVLLASTFLGGSVFTSSCWDSRSLMVGGFLFAAWLGAAPSAARSTAAEAAAPTVLLNEGRRFFTASPWACRSRRGHRWPPAHSGPGSGKSRCAASDLRARGWRGPVRIDSVPPTHRPDVAAADPCGRVLPQPARRRHRYWSACRPA